MDSDKEVKSQIIQGYYSTRLRRKALREDLNLDILLSSARALELSDKQATEIEKTEDEITYALKRSSGRNRNNPKYLQKQEMRKPRRYTTCRNCGGTFPHANKCPAYGKTSNFCKKPNHFEKMCRSKNRQQNKNYSSRRRVNQIDDNGSRLEHRDFSNSSTDDEYIFG